MKDNILMIISGPAGSGKNTVSERLMEEFPQVKRVITSTSRPPRGTEKNGIDYWFLTPQEFESGIEAGDFYEYAKVHDRYYGTSKKAVLGALESGDDLILIIDVQGAKSWKGIAAKDSQLAKRLTTIFVSPNSIDELRKRLCGRGTESAADIDRRMITAIDEFKQADSFDIKIDSTTKDADYEKLRSVYLKLKSRKA